ncbi:MAG: VOC family protein [Acidimicrobiales bacterium]
MASTTWRWSARTWPGTVDFYTNVLGLKLIKTLEIPGGAQHFFFDCGNETSLAFFWFPGAPEAALGVAAAANMPGLGPIVSAHGLMNHVAFDVPPERFDECVARPGDEAGVEVSPVLNHDDSETTIAGRVHPGVPVRSVYFQDPDGVVLEMCLDQDLRARGCAAASPTPTATGCR